METRAPFEATRTQLTNTAHARIQSKMFIHQISPLACTKSTFSGTARYRYQLQQSILLNKLREVETARQISQHRCNSLFLCVPINTYRLTYQAIFPALQTKEPHQNIPNPSNAAHRIAGIQVACAPSDQTDLPWSLPSLFCGARSLFRQSQPRLVLRTRFNRQI